MYNVAAALMTNWLEIINNGAILNLTHVYTEYILKQYHIIITIILIIIIIIIILIIIRVASMQ